jgi:hypothetical protein
MLKPLLIILAIVTLIAVALNLNLFSDAPIPIVQQSIKKSTQKAPVVTTKKAIVRVHDTNITITEESNLTKELQALLKQADSLLMKSKESDALLLYDKVIAKSKEATDVKILKLFAQACFAKATIYSFYPSTDFDAAKENYELVINKFKDKYNKELLLIYVQAKLQQAQITSKDQLLAAYDELIEKLEKDKEQRFEKEIEEMLYAKSFALMGVNDEEAIEVLDSLIAKYKDKKDLPENVKYSILNNIELSIITSNDTERYVDLANKYMGDEPHTKPILDMLSIIKNAQELDQDEALEEWNKEHSDYAFPDWDFSELRKWVNNMETPESQERVRRYLDIFEKQKYKNLYQAPGATVPVDPTYSDEATQNNYPNPYAEVNEDDNSGESETEERPYSEPDEQFTEEVLTPEMSYPNPYVEYEPNEEADGVSHSYSDDDY